MPRNLPRVIILYPTCDDFIEGCAIFAKNQDYANTNFFILDDSKTNEYKNKIDLFSKKYNINVVRRNEHPNWKQTGWKGGNLTAFLNNYEDEWDFFVVMDADTILQKDFVSKNITIFYSNVPNVGVIQSQISGCNVPSLFSRIMSKKINSENSYQESYRSHKIGVAGIRSWGMLVSRECYKSFGGYPDFVNDDTNLFYLVYTHGFKIMYSTLSPVSSIEPHDMITYYLREKRWWNQQIVFWRSVKFKTLKCNNIFLDFFVRNSTYAAKGVFIISTFLLVSAILFPIFYSTANYNTMFFKIFNYLLSANLLLFFFTLFILVINYMVECKSFVSGIQYFLSWLIYSAIQAIIAPQFVLKWIFHLPIKNKNSYFVTNKKYHHISLKEWFKFNKNNFIFLLIFSILIVIMSLLNVYVLKTNEFNFISFIISLCIYMFFFLIIILSTFLANITIKKNDTYSYSVLRKNNSLRKKYELPTIQEPVMITPKNNNES